MKKLHLFSPQKLIPGHSILMNISNPTSNNTFWRQLYTFQRSQTHLGLHGHGPNEAHLIMMVLYGVDIEIKEFLQALADPDITMTKEPFQNYNLEAI
jgi:hypothetical protein